MTRSPDRETITLTLTNHVDQAMARHLPGVAEGGALQDEIPTGKELRKCLNKLKPVVPRPDKPAPWTKKVQAIVGELRWLLRTMVRLTKPVHMLSCVLASPPELAVNAALGVLYYAYEHRWDGLTFHGGAAEMPTITKTLPGSMDSKRADAIGIIGPEHIKRAPREITGYSDATWSRASSDDKSDDVYVYAVTSGGAAVALELKKIRTVMSDSTVAEGYASIKLSHRMLACFNVAVAIGCAPEGPMLIASDNASNLRIATGHASVSNCKHALRRWAILVERVQRRLLRLAHVPDELNIVDFATKWVSEEKFDMSVDYLSGAAARAEHEFSEC
jgi:hypothetical protein